MIETYIYGMLFTAGMVLVDEDYDDEWKLAMFAIIFWPLTLGAYAFGVLELLESIKEKK